MTPAGQVSKYPLPQVEPRGCRTRRTLPRAPNCRGRLEQPLLRGVDECTRIVRDASKTRRGPQFMKLCPSNTLRSAALSVGQNSSLRVGNDPESGANESRRPECLPWWRLCRDIAREILKARRDCCLREDIELHCGSLSVGAQTREMIDTL